MYKHFYTQNQRIKKSETTMQQAWIKVTFINFKKKGRDMFLKKPCQIAK